MIFIWTRWCQQVLCPARKAVDRAQVRVAGSRAQKAKHTGQKSSWCSGPTAWRKPWGRSSSRLRKVNEQPSDPSSLVRVFFLCFLLTFMRTQLRAPCLRIRARRYVYWSFPIVSVVDEQNRHTQVQRMSSSCSIKRENSEELKEGEGGGIMSRQQKGHFRKPKTHSSLITYDFSFTLLPGQGGLSPTSPVVLEKPESLNTVSFSEDSV